MKKLIFSFLTLCLFASTSYAQLKVEAAGVKVGAETTPVEALDVEGAVKLGTTSSANAGTLRWTGTDFEGYDGSNWIKFAGAGSSMWSNNSGNAFFNSGFVGIGTDDPQQMLDISGDNTSTPGFLMRANSGGSIANFLKPAVGTAGSAFFFEEDNFFAFSPGVDADDVTVDNDNMFIVYGNNHSTYAGRTGIGTRFPAERLHVNGSIMHEGTVTMSDARLKTGISKYNRGLSTIMRLETVNYEYNGKGGTRRGSKHLGILAQDLQKLAPELVQEYTHVVQSEDTNSLNNEPKIIETETYLQIKDNEIKYLLINAIQEQQVIINKLEQRIDELEKSK